MLLHVFVLAIFGIASLILVQLGDKKFITSLAVFTNCGTIYALLITAKSADDANVINLKKSERDKIENQFELLSSTLNAITYPWNYHGNVLTLIGREGIYTAEINRSVFGLIMRKRVHQILLQKYIIEFAEAIKAVRGAERISPTEREHYENMILLEYAFVGYVKELLTDPSVISSLGNTELTASLVNTINTQLPDYKKAME